MKTTEKTVKGTAKKAVKENDSKLAIRKNYYAGNDVLQFNSTVKNAKNSNVPYLNNKQIWLKNRLLSNELEKNYTYTLDSLSNDYRKVITEKAKQGKKTASYQFRKSFKSGEVISIGDIKAVCQFMYIVNKRHFEFYRNDKNNYVLHEIAYVEKLTELKIRNK